MVGRFFLEEWYDDIERTRPKPLLVSIVDATQDLHEGRWDVEEKVGCALRIEELAQRVSVKLQRRLETPMPGDFVDSFLDQAMDSGELTLAKVDDTKIGVSQSIRRWMKQGLLARHPPSCLAMAA